MNEGVWQYLWGFIHAQRLGITIVCFLLLICIFITALIPDNKTIIAVKNYDSLLIEKKQYKATKKYHFQTHKSYIKKNDSLFQFDPNTISNSDLQLLGFSIKQIAVINKYRAKAHFYSASDFAKMYVVSPQHFKRLQPYISILDSVRPQKHKTFKQQNFVIVELNSADSTQLLSLPLIGAKRSATILKYRNKLGGFYTSEQLREVYGLHDSIIQVILPHLQLDTSLVIKININTAQFKELQQHPYIGYQLTKRIIEYRRIKGLITKLSDLVNDHIIEIEQYNKAKHYLIIKQ